jgi:hypothetical protein
MTREELAKRIQELSKAIAESAENHQRLRTMLEGATNTHNALVGRLDEANYLYQQLDKDSPVMVTEECTAA